MFLRTKKINNGLYCYLVQNKHTKNGPRQKVKKYLGKAIVLEKKKDIKFIPPPKPDKTELLHSLITWELEKHQFKPKNNLYQNQHLTYQPKNHRILNKKKEVTLNLNEGFLCLFTIKRILKFKKTNDFQKDAHTLAKYFIEAGLKPPQEIFVKYYQKC